MGKCNSIKKGRCMLVWIVGLIALLAVAYLLSPKTAIPGIPGPYPMIQNFVFLYLSFMKVNALQYMHGLQRRFGNIWSLYITGFGQVVTSLNAEDVEYVLNSNFDNFVRIDVNSDKVSWRMMSFFGRGIFAANGKAWHQQRNAARDYFTI